MLSFPALALTAIALTGVVGTALVLARHLVAGVDPSWVRRALEMDRRIEVGIDRVIARRAVAIRRWVSETSEATRVASAWAAVAVDATAPSPLAHRDLAVHASPALRLPHPVGAAVARLQAPVAGAVDRAEHHLRDVFPHGRAARHAARAFVASAVLGGAGLASAASLLTTSLPMEAVGAPIGLRVATTRPPAEPADPTLLPAADPVAAPDANPATRAPGPAPAPAPTPVYRRGTIPVGKGMWIYQPTAVEGGDPVAIVARAKAVGLTHLYVRTGSTKDGFYAQDFLNALLPVAHANGIRVFGWDFPHLDQPGDDVSRAWAAITYKTPDGHRIDGFAPDIETPSEGTSNKPGHAAAYGEWLRSAVGPNYPLVAVVPRPSPPILARGYPYAEVVARFDAIAPMVYWMDKDPAVELTNAMNFLAQFGKPVIPIGQAYDGGIDGGPGGRPSAQAVARFMEVAWQLGAPAASFWSWQHADQPTWDTIREAAEFRLPAAAPAALTAPTIRAYQHLLASLGYSTPPTGAWDPATDGAVRDFQRERVLAVTGIIDEPTLRALLAPFKPPLPAGVDPA